jgi:glycosyltransferase involved in cell wall biosynthesis
LNRLLILYDYFDPAYKAGGPIRSLVNLVKVLEEQMDIHILSSDRDHDGTALKVESDRWIAYGKRSKVQYLSVARQNRQYISKIIREVDADVIYVNGIYSLPFAAIPLRLLRGLHNVKKVIAPRGMLQKEPLSIKPFKKRMYLYLFRWLCLSRDTLWHVTTLQEETDLMVAGVGARHVQLIGNVPAFNADYSAEQRRRGTPLKFGTVALISPMKNILLVLANLKKFTCNIEYHLYGPVKDNSYWQQCGRMIEEMPRNIAVRYHGEIVPQQVAEKIAALDYYIQPSRSENFGHSIFAAFNQGVPVIISDQTPWKSLQKKCAGWDVDLKDNQNLLAAMRDAIDLNDIKYESYCLGARQMAVDYMDSRNLTEDYLRLFSTS